MAATTATIPVSGSDAQAAEGRARQAVQSSDASGGGIFAALLAQLLQIQQTGLTQDQAALQQSALTQQQSVQSASQINAQHAASTNQTGGPIPSANPSLQTTQTPGSATNAATTFDVQELASILSANAPIAHASSGPTNNVVSNNAGTPATASPTPQITLPPGQVLRILRLMAQAGQAGAPIDPKLRTELQNLSANVLAQPNASSQPSASSQPNASPQPSVNPQTPAAPLADSNASTATGNSSSATTIAALMQALAVGQNVLTGNPSQTPSQQQTSVPAAGSATANSPASPAAVSQTTLSTSGIAAAIPQSVPPSPSTTPAPASQGGPSATPQTLNDIQRQLFVQASHFALHQNAPASATEAQAMPVHLTNDQNAQGSQPPVQPVHAQTPGDGQSARTQTSAPGDSAVSAPAQALIPPAHDASTAQQAGNATLPANSVPPQASLPSLPVTAQPAQTQLTLQVGPTDSSFQANIQAIAVSVASQAQPGSKQFNIRLDPPELGRVDVRLMVDSTGKAQAHLAVDKPQTLELLQRDSGSLARALKDSGVQLNNNGLQFSLKGQSRQDSNMPPRGRALAVAAVPANSSAPAGISSGNFFASGSGVDIRV